MNNVVLMDGKKIKMEVIQELSDEVKLLDEKPKLVVIQVGRDEASNVYIKQKKKMAELVGYQFEHILFDLDVSEEEILEKIDILNESDEVTGILVQMPLPEGIDGEKIQNRIRSCKDVDGLGIENSGKLFHNREALYSCTPYGIMELLKKYNISVDGIDVVIVGKSNLVGKPMGIMMLNAGATVTICHSKTKNLAEYTKRADILVVAVGKSKLISSSMVKDGAVVIDVGINRLDTGLCGDVDFDSVKDKCSYITPVPGGVGPMTVAMLGKNVLKAYRLQHK